MRDIKLKSPQAVARRLLMDRRARTRFPCCLSAHCYPGGGQTGLEWSGTVRDVSLQGIGLVLPRHFPPGCVLTLQVHDEQSQLLLAGQVRVIFARHDAGGWLHGCQFFRELAADALERLVPAPPF